VRQAVLVGRRRSPFGISPIGDALSGFRWLVSSRRSREIVAGWRLPPESGGAQKGR
jgi:hypothetical protein